jgi:acyl-coenzyme A thioesterase PaaI-like protein
MPQSLGTRFERLGFNAYPCYRGTGAHITYIASNWREVHLKLPLSWRTRNYRGTIFGGSMYAAVDPIYMLMLIKNLGPGYNIWDKAATIRFVRPGRSTLFARFLIDEHELAIIQDGVSKNVKIDRVYNIDLTDNHDVVHVSVEKTIYIAQRDGMY